jgi:transposase InsO family protein
MTRLWPNLLDIAQVVQPETILRWHRAGFKVFWRWRSQNRAGRPKIDRGLRYVFTAWLRAMGIRDRPISPQSPWQNGYAERVIGTLRRECLDQMVIFGETHLRRILSTYAAYYNLQSSAHALGITERCPLASSSPTVWCHCRHSDLVWTASPIRSDMIFGKLGSAHFHDEIRVASRLFAHAAVGYNE